MNMKHSISDSSSTASSSGNSYAPSPVRKPHGRDKTERLELEVQDLRSTIKILEKRFETLRVMVLNVNKPRTVVYKSKHERDDSTKPSIKLPRRKRGNFVLVEGACDYCNRPGYGKGERMMKCLICSSRVFTKEIPWEPCKYEFCPCGGKGMIFLEPIPADPNVDRERATHLFEVRKGTWSSAAVNVSKPGDVIQRVRKNVGLPRLDLDHPPEPIDNTAHIDEEIFSDIDVYQSP